MDGRTIAACSADRSLKLWDSRTHQLIQHYPAHNDSVTDMSIHPVSFFFFFFFTKQYPIFHY